MSNRQEKHACDSKYEKQFCNTNLFLSAFGNFLIGVFCISQYFLAGYSLSRYITIGIGTIILLGTYGLSCSKASMKNERIWNYIALCSHRLGPLNPIILILGIAFAFHASSKTMALWILIESLHLLFYAFMFKKSFPDFRVKFVHKIWICAKNNVALVVTLLFAILFGILWYIAAENSRYADLWLNLSAGFIASFITISVIDRILRKQKEVNERPLRQAMYRDVQIFTSRLILLWQEMYLHSVEERTNMTVGEFFSTPSIEKIRDSLDLSCKANVSPEQTWFSHIENTRKDLDARGQKILTAYSNIAEPEVLQSIHYLINDSAYLGRLALIAQVHIHDVREHIPRPTLFRYYTFEPKESDLMMVSQLFDWCYKQYEKLHEVSGNAVVIVLPVPTQLNFETNNTKVTSAITEEKLNKMLNDFARWQQSQTDTNGK